MRHTRIPGALRSGVDLLAGFLSSCASACFENEPEPPLRPAWDLYRKGNFAESRTVAASLLESGKTKDAGRYLLCLLAHQEGRHGEAIVQYSGIRRSYPRRKLLVSPVAWSYIFMGDYAGALRHIGTSGVRQDPAQIEVLANWKNHPLMVEASGVIEIPFTEDGLSPFMPGLRVRINDCDTVARLDTGGNFIILSPAWAKRLGVRSTGMEKSFASLQKVRVGYGGFADLELGSFILRNVPVYVMEHLAAQSDKLAAGFGEELGPILGTNVFQQFLTTIDGPGRRFVLSPRGDSVAAAAHANFLSGEAVEFAFSMWDSHFMIARGMLGGEPINLFFDSGLVAVNPEQGQAALLVSAPVLESWGATLPLEGRFAVIPSPLAVGGLGGENPTAVPVPKATWKGMGDWGGMNVDALISWGFLKKFPWTLDFDRMTFTLRKPAVAGVR